MLFETFVIVVSMLIFAVGWHAHNRNLPGNIVLLACAFFGVGLLDFAHMLSYEGMPDFVTPSNVEKTLDFGLLARSLAAAALLAATVMPWRPFFSPSTRYVLFASVITATALAFWLILFHQEEMPHTFIQSQGITTFKMASEGLIIALNLTALFILWVRKHNSQPSNAATLFGAVCAMVLSEIFYTLNNSVTDAFNLLGHVYEGIAYLLLYRVFFVAAIEIPYRQQQLAKAKLIGTLDAIPDLVWLKDQDGVYLECNAAFVQLYGSEKSDIVGKTDYDFRVKELADSYREFDRKTMIANKTCVNEVWITFADGHSTLVETVKTPMHNDEGKLIGVLGIARDITERKRSEEVLNQFKYTLDQTLDSIFMFRDSDLRFIYVNEGAKKQVGYSSDELLGMTPLDIKPEFTLESFQEMVRPLHDSTQSSITFETVHRHKDGRDIPVEVFLQHVRREGAESRYMAIVHDITERKKNETEIERLSRAYRLLSRVNEAIVRAQSRDELFGAICSAAVESALFRFVWIGILDGRRLSVMPVAYAGVEDGYTSLLNIRLDNQRTGNGPVGRAIRGGTHVICQDIEHDPTMAPWRDEAIKRGYRASGMFPIREADSVVGGINVYAAETHFFTQDIIQLMRDLAIDVSFALDVFAEKKRREQAENELRRLNVELEHHVLARTSQLEDTNKELEAFSYSVSHDLRAPLRSIDGFSQILLKTYDDQLDVTGKDYLQRLRRASQHMGYLIDDMLQLSQVSRHTLKRVRIDLGEIAKDVAEDLRDAHPERQVRFILQEDLIVHGDYGLMRIVMDNLLGNAWKYTGKITGAEIEFGARDIDGERTFFVRDNGAGFNMDYAHKLFAPFQRLHGADEYEGTGIGLATVQRIIHRHLGKVWAEAKEGGGATFYFILPQREPSVASCLPTLPPPINTVYMVKSFPLERF